MILVENDVIVYIANTAEIVESGILVDRGTQTETLFVQVENVTVYDVELPEDIVEGKYCYEPFQGFFMNPNYIPPLPSAEERMDLIESIINRPNPNEIFLSLDTENVDLEELRTKKLEQINYLCNQEILNGFYSSALGEPHYYNFDEEAQSNLSGTLILVNGGQISSETIISWKTDGVPQNHTVSEFIQVCVDSFTHKQSKITKYWSKKYAILAMTTREDILTVNWID